MKQINHKERGEKEQQEKTDQRDTLNEKNKKGENPLFSDRDTTAELLDILLEEKKERDPRVRNERVKKILLLLAKGVALAAVVAAPKTASAFGPFLREDSRWKEWKQFNPTYLRRTIRKLEKQKIVEIENKEDYGIVKITQEGRKKILQFAVAEISIERPVHWDGRWRLVFYDVVKGENQLRDKFRRYLKQAGFYPLQESVYLHAFPCEKEINFLRYYLGIGSEVRIVVAEHIENDREFREYFGL